MSAGHISRAWEVFEALFNYPEGRTLADLTTLTQQPKAAVFRDLREFCSLGLVRQDESTQRYLLSYRIVGLSLRHLARTGVHDAAQPVLDRLARSVGELVRLAVVDGDSLVYVAWSQGRHSSLRYEPTNGDVAPLFCTATGHTFLASMPEDQAARLVSAQPPAVANAYGRNAPPTLAVVLKKVREAKARGYGLVVDSFMQGMTAVAAPVAGSEGPLVGIISIAVPTALCDAQQAGHLGREAMAAGVELADVYKLSRHFRQTGVVTPAATEKTKAIGSKR